MLRNSAMNSKKQNQHKWIPWERYIIFLTIDNSKKKKIGRVMRKDTAAREASRLARYKGYVPEVFDTKLQTVLNHEIKNQ